MKTMLCRRHRVEEEEAVISVETLTLSSDAIASARVASDRCSAARTLLRAAQATEPERQPASPGLPAELRSPPHACRLRAADKSATRTVPSSLRRHEAWMRSEPPAEDDAITTTC
ncbi:unnamed protein product [Pleuronectes platessa]|uniref:Uncharacterized protein n=1 Tax=Pleuronectes platessa TaxID=8262 RepID=A0A9N7VXK5_PLEPL|nr:unnamed protein product [Pleuronectes platessa]